MNLSESGNVNRRSTKAERERRQGIVLAVLVDWRDAPYGGLPFDEIVAKSRLTSQQVSGALRALKGHRLVDQIGDWDGKPGDWFAEWNVWYAAKLLGGGADHA